MKKLGTVNITSLYTRLYSNLNGISFSDNAYVSFVTSKATYKTTIECTITRMDTNVSVTGTYTSTVARTTYNIPTLFFTADDVNKVIEIKITLTARYSEPLKPTHYITVGNSGNYYGYKEGEFGSIRPATLTDSTGTYTWNIFSSLYSNMGNRGLYLTASDITPTDSSLRINRLSIIRYVYFNVDV